MSEDFLRRARMALHDMQGRVEGGKLAMFQRTIEYAEALQAEKDAAQSALATFIYETTHLSPEEDDGSHWCKISKECLEAGRRARSNKEPGAMTECHEIHIGDRVRVTEKASLGFIQPWRTRFKRGLTGTVVGADSWGNHVQWDVPKRVKYTGEWFMRGIQDKELEHAPEADQ